MLGMKIHFRFLIVERSDLTPRDAAKNQPPQTSESFREERKKINRKEQSAGDAPACKSPLLRPHKRGQIPFSVAHLPALKGR